MLSYEKVDAWKSAHALVIAVLKATRDRREQEPDIVQMLEWTALRAAGKLAFGAGTQNRRMFMNAVSRSGGFLSEFSYHLGIARVIGLLNEGTCTRLDALRGRASFYGRQLLATLMDVRPDPPES